MQLDHALRQISDIRQQMSHSSIFRGYRSITVGFSGVAGLIAAMIQYQWVASPETQLGRYLSLWLAVAAACLIAAGFELYCRVRRAGTDSGGSRLARQQTLLAIEQFLPSVAVGALMTLCIYHGAPHVAWMLPGLWSLIFGLGIFASNRLLPRQVIGVAAYYILCGCGFLLWGHGEHVFSPWQMGLSFGGGQLFGAAILYWTLERNDVASSSE